MILSGLEIKKHIGKEIIIEPFDEKRLNPNSYNLRLHNELLIYEENTGHEKAKQSKKHYYSGRRACIGARKAVPGKDCRIHKTEGFVPMLEGVLP